MTSGFLFWRVIMEYRQVTVVNSTEYYKKSGAHMSAASVMLHKLFALGDRHLIASFVFGVTGVPFDPDRFHLMDVAKL